MGRWPGMQNGTQSSTFSRISLCFMAVAAAAVLSLVCFRWRCRYYMPRRRKYANGPWSGVSLCLGPVCFVFFWTKRVWECRNGIARQSKSAREGWMGMVNGEGRNGTDREREKETARKECGENEREERESKKYFHVIINFGMHGQWAIRRDTACAGQTPRRIEKDGFSNSCQGVFFNPPIDRRPDAMSFNMVELAQSENTRTILVPACASSCTIFQYVAGVSRMCSKETEMQLR